MTDLSTLGKGAAGVWARHAALELMTPGELATRLRTGEWQTVWPGVHADGGFVLHPVQRAFAAVLAGGPAAPADDRSGTATAADVRLPRSVACGRTAARVWGLPLIEDCDPATGAFQHVIDDVAVTAHRRSLVCTDADGTVRELQRRRLRWLPGDVRQLRNGLWITSPLRTLWDCTQLLSEEALVCLLDDALHRGLVSRPALEDEVRRRRGRPGSAAFAAAVAKADGRAESPAETLTRLLLLPVLPGLVPQVRLLDDAARLVARFDLADEELRLAVEADGKAGHAGGRMVAKDRRRDERTDRHGWTTERVTWFELRRQQLRTRTRIVRTADRLRGVRAA